MNAGGAAGPVDASFTRPVHLPSLDGLRAIAILLVLVHQLGMLDAHPDFAGYLFGYAIGIGWVGVQLFFVLSGFLITGILLDTRAAANYYSGFYARRVLRIFPLYYLTLVVAFVLVPGLGTPPPLLAADQPNQVWLWIWLENWLVPAGLGSKALPHLWSLAVEEQFYLLWPLLVYRCDPARCLQWCLAIAGIALAARGLFVWHGAHSDAFYYLSICRMDALAFGGAAAALLRLDCLELRQRLLAWRGRLLPIAIGIALLGALLTRRYALDDHVFQVAGYGVLALVFALVVLAAALGDLGAGSRWLRWLGARPLAAIGKVSFAMYILHKPMHEFLGKPVLAALGADVHGSLIVNALYLAVGTLTLYLAGVFSYHCFEKHFLRFKNRFQPRTAQGAPESR